MFEGILTTTLRSSGILAGYVSTYYGQPAIFSEAAPEGVSTPYATFNISRMSTDNLSVESFNIYLDYYDEMLSRGGVTRADSRAFAAAAEYLLDQAVLTDARYDNIRISYESGGPVLEPDTRTIHYNLQFSARAGRKAWAATL